MVLFVTSTNAEISLVAVERERHSDGGKIKVKHASADEVSRALHNNEGDVGVMNIWAIWEADNKFSLGLCVSRIGFTLKICSE